MIGFYGNQLTVADSTGTTIRTYDELNRVLTKTVPNIGTSVYVYDIISGIEAGCIKETATDPKENITEKVYDKVGRLYQVTASGQTTSYEYYANGSRKSVAYPGGGREDYTYYGDGLLWTLTNKKSDGTILDTYTYEYDAAHNQTLKVDGKGTTSYTYDTLNRLLTVAESDGKNIAYIYDAAGNRIGETVTFEGNTTITTYTCDNRNRLTAVTTKLNNTVTEMASYVYDNNGNTLTVAKTPYIGGLAQSVQLTSHAYDLRNQLINTHTPDGTSISSTYNGEGLRVGKSVNGVLTRYLYEYDKVVLETDGNGNQTARNIYGINLIARNTEGQTLYYMYNGHADVTALLDAATGNIVGTYYYDAFGVIIEQTGNINNNITYAGYQWDKETGLYYCNARMYDPNIARFLQEDTYRGNPADPLSLNLYTYCRNEPIMYWDPTGYDFLGIGKWFKEKAENVKVGWKSLTGDHLAEDLRVIRENTKESSLERFVGEAIGGTVYNTKEGARVLSNKEERAEALKLINEYGSTSDKIIAHTANGYVNYVKKPLEKFVKVPYNAVYTGAKYAGRTENPLMIPPEAIEGTAKGLAGGIANIPPEELQMNFNKDWLTSSMTEALSDGRPQVRGFFDNHPFVKGATDGATDAVFTAGFAYIGRSAANEIQTRVQTRAQTRASSRSNAASSNTGASEAGSKTLINPNPFKGKTPTEIDQMFKNKGFETRGADPVNGYGGYVNPKTGRSYHIDPHNSFNEAPHVDVNRSKSYKGLFEKKKLFTGEEIKK